jgi:hypothetical protein
MNSIKITAMPFSAEITIGLEKGYTQELIPKEEVICFLQGYKSTVFTGEKIDLSAAIIDCTTIFAGQREPHLKINFINYLKNLLPENQLKKNSLIITNT